MVGKQDDLGDTIDARWALSKITKSAIKHYEEIDGGHGRSQKIYGRYASFLIGKNMQYFNTVMTQVKKYNPI